MQHSQLRTGSVPSHSDQQISPDTNGDVVPSEQAATSQGEVTLSIPKQTMNHLMDAISLNKDEQQAQPTHLEISLETPLQEQKVFSSSRQNRGWIIAGVADALSALSRWFSRW
jgi:hypothetical protein